MRQLCNFTINKSTIYLKEFLTLIFQIQYYITKTLVNK